MFQDDGIGGGAWTRTTDLRMSRQPGDDSEEFQRNSSVDSGKLLQNPQSRVPVLVSGFATVVS
jgi:hypothetical protein